MSSGGFRFTQPAKAALVGGDIVRKWCIDNNVSINQVCTLILQLKDSSGRECYAVRRFLLLLKNEISLEEVHPVFARHRTKLLGPYAPKRPVKP